MVPATELTNSNSPTSFKRKLGKLAADSSASSSASSTVTPLQVLTDLPQVETHSPSVCPNDSLSLFADDSSDTDSLFDEILPLELASIPESLALRTAPPIPGLFFSPLALLHPDLADSVMQQCINTYFQNEQTNQIMLFSRPGDTGSSLPPFLTSLLSNLCTILQPILPAHTHDLLFPKQCSRARQAILNLYQPGEGITPHVDLLGRFGDGIIGVSFGSGCVMRFQQVGKRCGENRSLDIPGRTRWDLYLPERSILVLSEEARYHWTHGIGDCTEDFVQSPCIEGMPPMTSNPGKWMKRKMRLSITFRWLLPGADVVGVTEGHP